MNGMVDGKRHLKLQIIIYFITDLKHPIVLDKKERSIDK